MLVASAPFVGLLPPPTLRDAAIAASRVAARSSWCPRARVDILAALPAQSHFHDMA
jgi:hypothetical protein